MGFDWRWPSLWITCLITIAVVGDHLGLTHLQQDQVGGLAGLLLLALVFAVSPAARHNLRQDHQWVGGGSECEECHPAPSSLYSDF